MEVAHLPASIPECGKSEFAFVVTIFGKDLSYCIEAAVFGYTLKKNKTKTDLVVFQLQ